MTQIPRNSVYMEWAKTCSSAPFNLATSGVASVRAREIVLLPNDVELTGPGGYGYAPLIERIAQHTGAPAECIVTAAGASMANYLAMSTVLAPGDEVLIERPGYGLFADVANYLQARTLHVDRRPESSFGLLMDDLERLTTPRTRLIVLSNLHNPSGAAISAEMLRHIGSFAHERGIRVLIDEVYLEMLFDANPPFAFRIGQQVSGTDNPFIVTNSLTKTYGLSGLRCGWILAAPHLSHRMWRLNDLFGVNAPHVSEQMSVSAFENLAWLRDRSHRLLSANRLLLTQFLNAHPELDCYRSVAGSVVFPKSPFPDVEQFLGLLRTKYETSVVPGIFFGAANHFRVGVGGETENVRGGLERLSSAMSQMAAG